MDSTAGALAIRKEIERIAEAVEKVKALGTVVIGFVDKADTPLEKLSDYSIRYPQNEQLKFFILADRLMYLAGDYPQYEKQYAKYDRYLPQALEDISPENVVAVGNYLNDRDMIENAGIGVAVGNAEPEIKALADMILQRDHNHDVVEELVDKLLAL